MSLLHSMAFEHDKRHEIHCPYNIVVKFNTLIMLIGKTIRTLTKLMHDCDNSVLHSQFLQEEEGRGGERGSLSSSQHTS